MIPKKLFDEWPQRYEQWFTTPVGKLVKEFEGGLIHELLNPAADETILDAGCGTGIFTLDFLAAGSRVIGLEISRPMLSRAREKAENFPFLNVQGDMLALPFADNTFDKTVSITALEFIQDASRAVAELFRVTQPGGYVVVATLNRLSTWALRRKAKTQSGRKHILENAVFRSPDELMACGPLKGLTKTAVHFQKDDDTEQAKKIEQAGRLKGLDTGAFVAIRWEKPRPAAINIYGP